MRHITMRDLQRRSGEVWRVLAEERDMVITFRGKPVAILSAVTPECLEDSLAALRQARAVVAVAAMQRRSVATGKHRMTQTQIRAEIAAARKTISGA
jgi:antitoxin (DNA-binding transcriptional repressor) of toxin-antitoxin stability system